MESGENVTNTTYVFSKKNLKRYAIKEAFEMLSLPFCLCGVTEPFPNTMGNLLGLLLISRVPEKRRLLSAVVLSTLS